MKKFYIEMKLEQDKTVFVSIKHNHKGNAESTLVKSKWIKDIDTETYYNMDKVVSFQIYKEEDI